MRRFISRPLLGLGLLAAALCASTAGAINDGHHNHHASEGPLLGLRRPREHYEGRFRAWMEVRRSLVVRGWWRDRMVLSFLIDRRSWRSDGHLPNRSSIIPCCCCWDASLLNHTDAMHHNLASDSPLTAPSHSISLDAMQNIAPRHVPFHSRFYVCTNNTLKQRFGVHIGEHDYLRRLRVWAGEREQAKASVFVGWFVGWLVGWFVGWLPVSESMKGR
jgi:hypothetical protein